MDFKFLKQIFEKCKNRYGIMLTLVLGVIFLTVIGFTLYYFRPSELSFVTGIIIFFGALPLLLSYQLVCSRILTNHDVNYNEIYKNYKAYFAPVFRGCYGVIFSIIISFLIYDLLSSIFFSLNFNPDLMEEILNYNNNVVYQEIERIMGLPSYNYFYIFMVGFVFLVFFGRILLRMPIPYFNYILGLPTRATKRLLKTIKSNNSSKYRKQLLSINFPLYLIFILGFYGITYIVYIIQKDISFAIFLGVSIALILCSFYLPIYVTGCFEIAMSNKYIAFSSIQELVEKELNVILKDNRLSDEQKNILKDNVDKYKKNIDESSKDNEKK